MRKSAVTKGLIVGTLILPASFAFAQGNANEGKVFYEQYCSVCHEVKGQRSGADLGKLEERQIVDVIKKGRFPLMPSFSGDLNDSEIKDLIAYLQGLAK